MVVSKTISHPLSQPLNLYIFIFFRVTDYVKVVISQRSNCLIYTKKMGNNNKGNREKWEFPHIFKQHMRAKVVYAYCDILK